jgi:signal transduction histidine kinase
MQEMGGKIKVSSDGKGKGTTFTLVFPILKEQELSQSY